MRADSDFNTQTYRVSVYVATVEELYVQLSPFVHSCIGKAST